MRDQLLDLLEAAGKPGELVRLANGSYVLLLAHGARVLGLFAADDPRNFYWTHPALDQAASARELFDSEGWQNTGGDRTWLAPEIDFFFPKYPDLSVYHQPREFDPGQYRLERSENGAIRFVSEFTLRLSRRPDTVTLRLSKMIESVADPIRLEGWRPAGVSFAGYGLRTALEFAAEASRAPVGLWHLIQMPHGGEMILPTYSPVRPTVVFGEISAGDLRVVAPGVRYRMHAPGEQKISLRAIDCPGRVGYFHEHGEASKLIVRNFFVNPSGAYVDAAWHDPDDTGYAVQACNVNSHLGQFSELEYHIPAIGVSGQPDRCEDFAQTWAWRGPRRELALIAQRLLGVELEPT